MLKTQLEKATNASIRKMKEGEIKKAKYIYDRECRRLEQAEDSADIHTRAVVFGVMQVV